VRQQISKLVRTTLKNQQSNFPALEILLIRQRLIYGQENIKPVSLGQRQQFTILSASEAGFWDCRTRMFGKALGEISWYAFVDQDVHPMLASS
jgi:hypothetical protein